MRRKLCLIILTMFFLGGPVFSGSEAALINPGFDQPPGGGAGVAPGWSAYDITPGLPPLQAAAYFFGQIVPQPQSPPSVQEWWGPPGPQIPGPFWGGIFQQDWGPFVPGVPYVATVWFEDPWGFGPTSIRLGVDPSGGPLAGPWGPLPNPLTTVWSNWMNVGPNWAKVRLVVPQPILPGATVYVETFGQAAHRVYVDSVSFRPIPLPNTVLLLGSGLLALIGFKRRGLRWDP